MACDTCCYVFWRRPLKAGRTIWDAREHLAKQLQRFETEDERIKTPDAVYRYFRAKKLSETR
jgi:hypothetical protein